MKRRTFLDIIASAALALPLTGCRTIALKALLATHPKARDIFSPPTPDRHITGTGVIEHLGDGVNRVTVLYLHGENHYSLGYWHGKLLGPEVKATIEEIMHQAEKFLSKYIPREVDLVLSKKNRRELVARMLDKAAAMMEPFTPPEELEEMRGLADGLKDAGVAGVTLTAIKRAHAIPDLSETSCSALVARGGATRDRSVWQLRILDYGIGVGLEKRPLITVYYPTRQNEHAFINIGWIGFVGAVTGMNEKGVCISELGLGKASAETLAGTPMPFLLKQALRYGASAPEAAAIIRAAQRTNSYAYCLGDSAGEAVGMITSSTDCSLFRINQVSEVRFGKMTLPQFADVIYAGHHGERQGKLVQKMHGMLECASIQTMAREIAMESNLHTAIFDLSKRDLWIANREGNRRAADCTYVKFPFDAWRPSPHLVFPER
ncbi:MAG: hypothetical protein Greene041679_268 [Parcubacteria group bacterium Greene0416_79]|nr:MAG: hypothetical protein Greene041679_268 [Parcubacteria group bacterium Greene0416_79]